jgi:hypothetical protein
VSLLSQVLRRLQQELLLAVELGMLFAVLVVPAAAIVKLGSP